MHAHRNINKHTFGPYGEPNTALDALRSQTEGSVFVCFLVFYIWMSPQVGRFWEAQKELLNGKMQLLQKLSY